MTSNASKHGQRVYRVDRFRVPDAARAEFLERVRTTHESLKSLPGFIEDFVLEQAGGPGVLNFMTMVIWEDAQALGSARAVMTERQRAMGFDAKEMFSRLNIEAELASYAEVSG